MTLPGRVRAFAVRHGLWEPDRPVVAAVSGGADSTALLLLLHDLARDGKVALGGVAHLHHHIRSGESDLDAAFVEDLAGRLGLPFQLAHEDVPGLAQRTGTSLEVAGRNARLALFTRIADGPARPVVALAHTRDDQAETVLLRLVRGAGPRGLAGMAPRHGHRVRPLLDIGREELRTWLLQRGQGWREDRTNEDTSVARNHLRRTVLPLLAQLNPSVIEALARAARIQAEDGALLDSLAAAETMRMVAARDGEVQVDLGGLRQLPESLARRVIRKALATVEPGYSPDWRDTEAVLRSSGSTMAVGPVTVELFGQTAVLSSSKGRARNQQRSDPALSGAFTLQVPGFVRHPSGWWELEATGPTPRQEEDSSVATGPQANRAVLDAGALGRHLTIRGWLPGDRVQPLGLPGRKKLQDVFVDRKVPRDERQRVPVVIDARGRIAWVGGLVVGESFRVTPHSEAVVVLTLRR